MKTFKMVARIVMDVAWFVWMTVVLQKLHCNTRCFWGAGQILVVTLKSYKAQDSGIFTIICFQQYLLIQQGLKWKIYSGSYSKKVSPQGIIRSFPLLSHFYGKASLLSSGQHWPCGN